MKQILSEEFRRMQKLAGLITESSDPKFDQIALDYSNTAPNTPPGATAGTTPSKINEANPTLDQNKLKSLILAIKQFGGSRSDKRDFSEIAKLLVNNELAKAAEMITLLDTSPNELFYEMMDETYPELWDMLFDAGEDDYIALSTPKADLNEWAIDMNAARTLITPENVDEYGEYDGEDTFEVENGSDRMADFWGDIYIAHEGDPEDWWDNEKVMGPLRYRFEQAINKAVKQKYGPDVTVEYY
jgi:hypothetical protein